jgi:hypothetical protein
MCFRQSSVSLGDAFKSHQSLSLTVSLAAPVIIIPVSPTDKKSDVMVVNFGHLSLTSPTLQSKTDIGRMKNKLEVLVKSGRNPDDELLDEKDRALCYDRWSVQLTRMEAFLATDGPNWRQSTHAPLLHEFTVNIDLLRCVAPDIVWLPRMKIAGELPKLALAVSATKVRRLIALGGAFSTLGQQSPGDMINTGAKVETHDGDDVTKNRSKDSILSLEELTLALKSEKDAKQLLSEIDADGNGEVSIREYEAWLVSRRKKVKLDRQLQLSFTLQEVELTISNDIRHHYDVVKFKIDGIGMVMTKRSFDMHVALHVKSLALEDKVTRYVPPTVPTEAFRYILTTKPAGRKARGFLTDSAIAAEQKAADAGSFVSVDYLMTQRESPDFAANPVEQKIDVGVGALILGVDPETVQKVALFFIRDFMPPPSAPSQAPAQPTPVAAKTAPKLLTAAETKVESPSLATTEPSSVIPGSPLTPAVSQVESKSDTTKDTRTERESISKMRVTATFGGLKVFLNAKGQAMTRVAISGFTASFNQYENSLSAHVELYEISVKDLTPFKSLYKEIVKVSHAHTAAGRQGATPSEKPKPLVSVQFDTYSPKELKYPGYNGEINASVQGLRFVFLMRFIQELQYFATAGPLAALSAALAADAHAATSHHHPTSSGAPLALPAPSSVRTGAAGLPSPAVTGERKLEIVPAPTLVATPASGRGAPTPAAAKPEEFSFFKVTAHLTDVELIVPRSSTSLEAVTARIDGVHVKNSIEKDRHATPGQEGTHSL